MRSILACFMVAFCFFTSLGANSAVETAKSEKITLSRFFTDHAVLQRGQPIKVWGWATPKSKVEVEFDNKKSSAVAGADGKWVASFPAMKAGGPYDMTVTGDSVIKVKDILIGDVWLCGGQSNMAWSVINSFNGKMECRLAEYPNIRLFSVVREVSNVPVSKLWHNEAWEQCNPETIRRFSAVGYFFGRELYRELKIPIGLINCNWGGTTIETWMSPEAVAKIESLEERVNAFKNIHDADKHNQEQIKQYDKKIQALANIIEDKKNAAEISNPDFNDYSWENMQIPGMWEKRGLKDFNGLVWFRKTIFVPDDWAGKELILKLGPIDEIDNTWFNGYRVGSAGSLVPYKSNNWNVPREYRVPGEYVKAGKNVITVQVIDLSGAGGLWGQEAKEMYCIPAGAQSGKVVSLAGTWKYKIGIKMPVDPRRQNNITNYPSVLFGSMLKPVTEFPVAGAIWYQGESNASRAWQYRELFPAMIQDWRKQWGIGDFPFIFVQLANYRHVATAPEESEWAELREAQTMTLKEPATGMAVTIDIGEGKDIHPKNKQEVGRRLALYALSEHYGKPRVFSGPVFKSMKIDGDKIILSFNYVAGGLVAKDGPLKHFAIAGEDRKFVWAEAEIVDDKIEVRSSQIKKPVAVRYAWAYNPEGCNLYNKEGLPASPFRTDSWPGLTEKKK